MPFAVGNRGMAPFLQAVQSDRFFYVLPCRHFSYKPGARR